MSDFERRLTRLFSAGLTGLAASSALSAGQAQELDRVESPAACASSIGCQHALGPKDRLAAQTLCAGDEPLMLTGADDRLVLTIRSGARPNNVTGTLFTQEFEPIGDRCWAASWRLPRLDQSKLIFYGFNAQGRRIGQAVFEGEHSRARFEPAALRAEIETVTLQDSLSGIERVVHIYAPPQLGGTPAPVLILPDGQTIRRQARIAQRLFDDGHVPAFLIVALESRMDTPFARAFEYVPQADNDRHAKHMAFFQDSFLPWILERFEGRVTDQGWLIYGESLSATFALSTAQIASPIDHVIAASPASSELDFLAAFAPGEVEFHIAAGLYEDEFRQAARGHADRLRRQSATVRAYCYFSGHDLFTWEAAFTNALIDIFADDAPTREDQDAPICPD